MIKLISKNDPDILAFRIREELEQEDVDWLIKRVVKRQKNKDENLLLYVEFENFGELTYARMWKHFKMLVDHVMKLMIAVNRIAIISSDNSLREKLSLEFALVPTISLKAFHEFEKEEACTWLTTI